jgi:ribosomal protein L29
MRKKDKGELLKELEQLRSELHKLRVAQVTGGTPAKLAQMYAFVRSTVLALSFFLFLLHH